MSAHSPCDIVLADGLVSEAILIVFRGAFRNGELVYIEVPQTIGLRDREVARDVGGVESSTTHDTCRA